MTTTDRAVNLDAMTDAELETYIESAQAIRDVGEDDRATVTGALYACLILSARPYRRLGDIEMALKYEQMAEEVYGEQMPDEIKW